MNTSNCRWQPSLLGLCLTFLWAPPAVVGQDACPTLVDAQVAAGWDHYRGNEIDRARLRFADAVRTCPTHIGARVGLGYTALRTDDAEGATRWFTEVLRDAPRTVDALAGLGLLAWRRGDLPAVRDHFSRVIGLDPGNPQAREYLDRLPAGLGPPPRRPPLVLPDSLTYPARVHAGHFDTWTADGWRPFYIKGINLGAALPGRHPSEFPDSATYADWLTSMAEMGVNAIRVYTIHPPSFYGALAVHNAQHPDNPLLLLHGVWIEPPPNDNYDHPTWNREFADEMRRVVDLLHGRADVLPRPGHASGHYTVDVSRWVLAYIIGREWEPETIKHFNQRHPGPVSFTGTYLRLSEGTAADRWMVQALETLVAYETETYRSQRPVAYTNWPTLDPLHHPTEATVAEELAIRRSFGEVVARPPLEYENDVESLDATLISATDRFPAGYFAAFHAYPYYPDFMILDPAYSRARSPEGPSNYFGYLQALKRHHGDVPIVIAEYGVPGSLGIAHLQPQGWHHGGHDEDRMAAINARMTREIAAAGLAGGALFAWIDEWFKKNWLVIDFEIPLERNRLWLNRLDAEQQYGVIALEPVPPVAGETLAERLEGWRAVEPLYTTPDGGSVRATVDEASLWLLVDLGARQTMRDVFIGIDLFDPEAGDFRWPLKQGPALPVGIEFVVHATQREVRLMADRASNPFVIDTVRAWMGDPTAPRAARISRDAPPGVFTGRFEQRFNSPYVTRPNDDGLYDSLRVITNRPRFGRDSTEYGAIGYDRGVLRRGSPPDGTWERLDGGTVLELRLPWMLLNFTDPSQRRVLQNAPGHRGSADASIGTATVESIGIVVGARAADGTWQMWPNSTSRRDVARFTWPSWEEPRWRARRRPVFDAMRSTFNALTPPATMSHEHP